MKWKYEIENEMKEWYEKIKHPAFNRKINIHIISKKKLTDSIYELSTFFCCYLFS